MRDGELEERGDDAESICSVEEKFSSSSPDIPGACGAYGVVGHNSLQEEGRDGEISKLSYNPGVFVPD